MIGGPKMTFIFILISSIASLAIIAYPIIYLVLRKSHPQLKFWKIEGILLGISVAFNILSINNGTSTKNKTGSSPKTEQVKLPSVSENNSSYSSTHNTTSETETDLSKLNTQIALDLEQDKGFANGTLDENGQPVDQPLAPNPDFEFANYIDDLKFAAADEVTVQVSSEFMYLPPESKDQIASRVRGLALSVASTTQPNQNIHLVFKRGTRQIGRTAITQNNHFKWNKSASY